MSLFQMLCCNQTALNLLFSKIQNINSSTYLSSCGPSTVAPLRGAAVPASCAGDGLADPDRNWRKYWTAVALRSWRSRTDWEASVRLSLTTLVVRLNKRYFIIDQQIARHFVHYSECLSNPLYLLCNYQPLS